MINSLRRSYHLVTRGEAGLACDDDGVVLGGVDLARVHINVGGEPRCEVRSPDEISEILQTAYGPQPEEVVLRLHRGLGRAAAAIESGDLGRAGIEAVKLGLPALSSEAMTRLTNIANLEKAGAPWETEPRVSPGRRDGGQWTAGGGGSGGIQPGPTASTKPIRPERPTPRPTPVPCGPPLDVSASGYGGSVTALDRNLLIPVSTAAPTIDGYGPARDLTLPKGAARMGRAGLLTLGAALLDNLDARAAREQITNAITRFGLDANRPADVMAANAYVWSRYYLPWFTEARWNRPDLDAASEAVMRFVMVNPSVFATMHQDQKSLNLIIAAANGGLADYESINRVRPAGVEPALQTTSSRARAAITNMLLSGRWQAHHLVPAAVWKENHDIARTALEAGWKPDLPSNLIGLPADERAREELGGSLPIHNRNHPLYSIETTAEISRVRAGFPSKLSALQARAILDSVALHHRLRILAGAYNPLIKVHT